jgi:prepilin-type N-terminal cleavage/methylation domain-containing protein/prepilin-type processing-associated H-X9-DG protein
MNRPRRPRGFTVVELLVSIAIVVILATAIFAVLKQARNRAQTVKRLNNIRTSGSILLGKAQDMNGRASFFAGGQSGGFDLRPYNIVRDALGIPRGAKDVCEIMHWDVIQRPPDGNLHWNCYAVNFQNVPDLQIFWKQEAIEFSGGTYNVKSLLVSAISRPSSYPLLIDSSQADGREIFRINESGAEYVGLRNNGKANAYFFDGSSRSMDKAELKAAGFTRAYDNSVNPPKVVQLR